MARASQPGVRALIAAGGETGALLSGLDRDGSPLGPAERWPGSLCAALSICLGSTSPMAVCWGPELVLLCNDAFRPLLGPRSPGRPARQAWPELEPALRRMMRDPDDGPPSAEAVGARPALSLSPIHDEAGRVAGVLVTASGVEEQRRVQELERMQDMARGLAATLEPDSVLDALVRAACSLGAAGGARGLALVLRADPATGRVTVAAPAAEAGGPFATALRRHAGSVLDTGRPVRFRPADVATATERRSLVEAGVGAVAMVAVPVGDERFGVLAVGFRRTAAVTPSQLRHVALLADLGGLAIANATAYQREHRERETSQRRLRELALLHEATRTFSSTLALDEIEREIARTAARLVAPVGSPASRAIFYRVDGEIAMPAHEDGRFPPGTALPVASHPQLARALAERRAVAAPVERLGPGGEAFREAGTHVAFAPVVVQDRPYGAVAVALDDPPGFDGELLRRLEAVASLAELAIANGRHLEAVRREGERLAELEEVKSRFMRLASHELRGPLAVLRGYLSMLVDGTFPSPTAEVADVYAVLDGKAGQMEMLVAQLLEAARLEEGRLRMDLRRLDLREPVQEAFRGARLTAGPDHDLRLALPAEPAEVMADAWRVTTIVANLLDNAVKYSPGGGPVRCAVRVDGGSALVEVTDRGLGIAEADRATLFTRFGRIVTRENSHIQGTGLGLHLSRELALMQRGTLDAASEAGAGSTFTLTLPLAPPAG